MTFNLPQTLTYKRVSYLKRTPPAGVERFLALVCFAGFVVSIISDKSYNLGVVQSISFILFAAFGVLFLDGCFKTQKIIGSQKPDLAKVSNPDNIAESLDLSAVRLLFGLDTRDPLIAMDILERLLKYPEYRFIREKLNLGPDVLIDISGDGCSFDIILSNALNFSQISKDDFIKGYHIFAALAQSYAPFKNYLAKREIFPGSIISIGRWQERIEETKKESKHFWDRDNLIRKNPIGRNLSSGFTYQLDKFATDLRVELDFDSYNPKIIYRQSSVDQLAKALAKGDGAFIVGDPGVDRHMIVKDLMWFSSKGLLGGYLNNLKFFKLDASTVISHSGGSFGQIEPFLESLFNEAIRAKNVVIVIDGVHNFLSPETGVGIVGKINISSLLTRYFGVNNFRLIGITNPRDYASAIESNPEVSSHIEKIEALAFSEDETLTLLEDTMPKAFTYRALEKIIEISQVYIQEFPLPKKAIDLANRVVAESLRTHLKVIDVPFVEAVASQVVSVPIGQANEREKEILLSLEDLMQQRVIGQEFAISEIANALRRARAEVRKNDRPIGSFLFLGPTGVGKTETAKALAANYFGEEKIIRLDMSEFQDASSIERIIGNAKEGGVFTDSVRDNPFSLILLDEIEKAHPSILNLFLTILDEGYISDGLSRKISFLNTIIIATSNAGANQIRDAIEQKKDLKEFRPVFIDYLLDNSIFKPEFINRFDDVVLFSPLTQDNLAKIAKLQLKSLAKTMQEQGIIFNPSDELCAKIAEMGFKTEFGGREIRRIIQDNIQNAIAKQVLSGVLTAGSSFTVNAKDFSLNII